MNQILKSTIDTRLYKALQLPNKLLCLLISDKDTEKSAAALNVEVGSLEDPFDRQGLAHFCEHMLFMGTTKYPKESEYQDFISKNSGQTNAFTSETNTNYHFSVANNALEGALDRFSQFFTSPLFSDTCTDREMNAVDSEYNLNLQNDFWRKFQLFHNAAEEGSTYNKFMIGNLKTLKHDDIRERLLKFHKQYYSANVMKLVVYGSQPIQELEQWATQMFSNIENKNIDPPRYNEIPFKKENLGKLIKYVPIKDQDYLEISWIIDYLYPHYRNCPGKYISHMLGHEGENSLLSLLIKEDLAQELSSGPSNDMKCFSQMIVRIKLTKKGLQNYQRVLSLVFQYIELLKQKGTQQWIFDEIQKVKKIDFDYSEKQNPFYFVTTLANRLQLYPVEEVLRVPYLMEKYESELIQNTINQLNNDNIMIFLSSQEFNGKLGNKEQYFGTEYSIDNFGQDIKESLQIQQIHQSLNLPPINIYLPQNTNIINKNNQELPKYPQLIIENEQTAVYFKQDNQFEVPKTIIQLRIYTNGLGFGKLGYTEVLARLWISLLNNHIRELNYLAEMAKIDSSINLAPNGFEITISGFSDSTTKFVGGLFSKLLSFKVEDYQNLYETNYIKIRKDLENFKRQPPYQQVHNQITQVLRVNGTYDIDDLLMNHSLINFEDLVHFNKHIFKRCRYEWLITGNLDSQQAKYIALETQQLFNAQVLTKDQVLDIRTLHLPKDIIFNYTYHLSEQTETNSAVVVHYQFEAGNLRLQLINDILANMIKSPFFSQLRTVEQLGYAVFSMTSDLRGISGFSFLIQSNVKCPNYVQERIRLFINETLKQTINNMTQEQFDQYIQSVRVALLEKDYSLKQEAGRFWMEVQRHKQEFDRKERQLELLDTVTLEEVQKFFIKNFIEEPRQFELHAISPTHLEEQKQVISHSKVCTSMEYLKRRLPLYPDYYSLL